MVTVTNPPNVNLSQLIIDADLAMGAHNITLGAGQLVDGRDVSTLISVLSELGIDADLAMGAHNITLGAAQTVDGMDVSTLTATRVVTGVYTGDGAVSQEIATGLTTIKGVIITAGITTSPGVIKLDNDAGAWSRRIDTGVANTTMFTAAGITGGSFFVDDNGADAFPNKNLIAYRWIAWGD